VASYFFGNATASSSCFQGTQWRGQERDTSLRHIDRCQIAAHAAQNGARNAAQGRQNGGFFGKSGCNSKLICKLAVENKTELTNIH